MTTGDSVPEDDDFLHSYNLKQYGIIRATQLENMNLFEPENVQKAQAADDTLAKLIELVIRNPSAECQVTPKCVENTDVTSLEPSAQHSNAPDLSKAKAGADTEFLFYLDRFNSLFLDAGVLKFKNYVQNQCTATELRYVSQTIVPKTLVNPLLKLNHEGPGAVHPKPGKMALTIARRFMWYKSFDDIKAYVASCETCARVGSGKAPGRKNYHPMPAAAPMAQVQLDLVGPLPEVEFDGKSRKFILVIGERLSRYFVATAIENKKAETVADALMTKYISYFGTPAILYTDNGKEFENQLLIALSKLLGFRKMATSAYCPQSNGLVERFNKTMVEMLRTLASEHTNWAANLSTIMMAYNTTVHKTTGVTPAELLFGWLPRTPSAMITGENPTALGETLPATVEEYVTELRSRLKIAHDAVKERYGKQARKLNLENRGESRHLQRGDTVWYYKPHVRHAKQARKQVARSICDNP